MRKQITGCLALFLLALACGCSSQPLSQTREYAKAPTIHSPAFAKYLDSLLGPLKRLAGITGSVSVDIKDSAQINAAIRRDSLGIVLSRGMLNVLSNEAQLVALLGHELGHSKLHQQAQRTEEIKKSVFSAVDGYVSRWLPKSRLADKVHSEAREMVLASFGQQEELDADIFGARLASKAGYDPKQFALFFDALERLQAHSLFTALQKLKGTHPFLGNRATAIRALIEREKLGGIRTGEAPYRAAVMALLKNREAQDPQRAAALQDIQTISTEIRNLRLQKRTLSLDRFIQIMETVRAIQAQYHLKLPDFEDADSSFMEEALFRDTPLWSDATDPELTDKMLGLLAELGKMGVGSLPVIGDAIDLYEVVTGNDFYTGEPLSFESRVASAAGLAIGSGAQWRGVLNAVDRELGQQGARVGQSALEILEQAQRKGLWDPGRLNHPVKNAFGKYKKHANEFPEYRNSLEYVAGAHDFIRNPPSGTLSKPLRDGSILHYHPPSNTMAISTPDGVPHTIYRPDPKKHGRPTNLDYYHDKK